MAEQDVNFQLVSTYLPLVFLILRAGALVAVMHLISIPPLSANAMIVTLCAVAYFDSLAFRNNKLSCACGNLCPVALCLMVGHLTEKSDSCQETSGLVALWTVDLMWAVSCSSFLGIAVFRGVFVVDVTYASVAWAVCAIIHTQINCHVPDVVQVLARTFVYYISCSVYFYFRNEGKNLQPCVMHIFWHILLVKNHVLLASLTATAITTTVVYYNRFTAAPRAAPRNEGDDLMRELRAAKVASSSV